MPHYALETTSSHTPLGTVNDVLGDGIAYVKVIGRLPWLEWDADDWVAQSARVSTQTTGKDREANIKLIRRLLNDGHMSPFEQVLFSFEIRLPLFAQIHILRHRMGRYNVESARYRVLKDEFYFPSTWGEQSKTNKQGSTDRKQNPEADSILSDVIQRARAAYESLIALNISREMARTVLPVNYYSSMWMNMDLRNLLHFFELRCDPAAQWETRQIALSMQALVAQHCPEISKIWMEKLPDETKQQIQTFVLYPTVGAARTPGSNTDTEAGNTGENLNYGSIPAASFPQDV